MANSRAVSTLDEAIEHAKYNGFFAIKLFGGLQILAEPNFEAETEFAGYGKAILIQFFENQWHLLDFIPLKSCGTLHEAVLEAERCLYDNDYYMMLWKQAKENSARAKTNPPSISSRGNLILVLP
jgi:hypothetical protein